MSSVTPNQNEKLQQFHKTLPGMCKLLISNNIRAHRVEIPWRTLQLHQCFNGFHDWGFFFSIEFSGLKEETKYQFSRHSLLPNGDMTAYSATRNIKISLYQQSFPVLHKLHFFYMKWIKAPSTSVIKELWQIHVNGGRIFCSWRVNIISHRHLLRYDRVLCQLRCCGVL